jgi:DNA-binding MarR family transcriptional regulator
MEAAGKMDMMREFSVMALANRLRRLSDRLKPEATRLYRANGIEFNDGWFLAALLLSNSESISVTQIAESFGISHAAVSQMVAAMKKNGLVTVHKDECDRRRTIVRLTDGGRASIEALKPYWKAIGECTEDLIASTGKDLLATIVEIEEQL